MSSVAASSPVRTYASVLQTAKHAFSGIAPLLENATADNKVKGSIRNLTDECNEHVSVLKSNSKAQNFEEIKKIFIQFTKPLIPLYLVIQSTRDIGLKAIETLKQALATCTANKKTDAERSAIRIHLQWLGVSTEQFDALASQAPEDFTEQIKTLTSLTSVAQKQIKSLEGALNTVFYNLKVVEGKNGWSDKVPSPFTRYYLNQALADYNEIQAQLISYVSGSAAARSSDTGSTQFIEGTALVQKRRASRTPVEGTDSTTAMMLATETPPLQEVVLGANM